MRTATRTLAVTLLAVTIRAGATAAQVEPTVVYLVRHAEKVDASADPALSPEGRARAALLADLLVDAGITHVHSSDFMRTRDTAAPLAGRLGLPILLYDPRDLASMAALLRSTPGRHLVTGHSNTTPRLVELLGGDPHTPIDDAAEYDRLYVVTLLPEGKASTVLLRYGRRFEGR